MYSVPILYQDSVDGLLRVLSLPDTPNEPSCSICGQGYGKAGPGIETHLDYLNHLPGAFRKTFIQHKVEAVNTPCNHTFCTFCISKWLLNSEACNCPICRFPVHIQPQLGYENANDDLPDAGIEGLAISLHLSTDIAQEIFNILKLSTRQLLTTKTSIPFVWCTKALLSDLPKIMVTIARRFHYQSRQAPVPTDIPFMKLHNHMDRLVGQSKRKNIDLKYLCRTDAPLAQHPDAHLLYNLLCTCIKDLEDVMGDGYGRCPNWEGPAKLLLYKIVNERMPDADGGVGQQKWWAFVWCVIKGLLVWQAYSERVQKLSARRMTQISVNAAGSEESVRAYRIE